MHKLVSRLILYSDLGETSILNELSGIFKDAEEGPALKEELSARLFSQIKRLLDLSTELGFDGNLWQNYLTYVIIFNENSFSLTCEGCGASADGSVNIFAKHDFSVFMELFSFDFSALEEKLGTNCFDIITSYSAIAKHDAICDKNASRIIRELSDKLAHAKDADEFLSIVSGHYKNYGVGALGLNRAFRIKEHTDMPELVPIRNADRIMLSDLCGYERQKAELVRNTEAFCKGLKANNVLLYGDAGTGKSSSIKAVLNEYCHMGLRMVEIYKSQFSMLSNVIAKLKKRNYKFIIYIDDLSFEENEIEYKFLKAVIEGGVENRPDNILIYATSNRRHLVKETWKDRDDMEHNGDVHRSETMQEKLSLAARFGIAINYPNPSRQEYYDMVAELAKRAHIDIDEEDLRDAARKWELRHGAPSGRTAQQLINYLSK